MAARRGAVHAIWILILLAAAACSPIHGGPTGYRPIDPLWGNDYGYRDKQIGADEFSVFAVGNPGSPAERVAEIALLRAAHLTLEHDRSHFLVVQRKAKAVTREALVTVPVVLPGVFLPVPVAAQSAEEQVAILIVRLLPEDAAMTPEALDASAIVSHLSARLEAE